VDLWEGDLYNFQMLRYPGFPRWFDKIRAHTLDCIGRSYIKVTAIMISISNGTGSDMKFAWIIALGVVSVIAGFVALGSILMATVVSVLVVGIMMVIAGVAEVIGAFQLEGWGRFLLWILMGALYIVAGIVTFNNPLLAAAVLTLILGFALVASGI